MYQRGTTLPERDRSRTPGGRPKNTGGSACCIIFKSKKSEEEHKEDKKNVK